MARYHFGKTTFSNYVWIRGGAAFYNLQSIDLEKHNRNRIALEVYDSSGKYYGRGITAAAVNWSKR